MRGRKKEDRATGAYHESGHVVAVLLCGGLFIVSVSIRPDKTRGTGEWYSAGRTSYGPPFLDLDKKPGNIDDERWATVVQNIVEKQVKILMAGEAAQLLYSPTLGVQHEHVDGDRKETTSLLSRVVPDKDMTARTDQLMQEVQGALRENWAAVEGLAKLLIARGKFSGDEVEDCVGELIQ